MTIDAKKLHLIRRLMDISSEEVLDKIEAIIDASPVNGLLADVQRIERGDTTDFKTFANTYELA